MLLYKLRERQSWGRGSHGALCCLQPHQCPAPAWDRSRTQQGHEHQILQGIKKMGSGTSPEHSQQQLLQAQRWLGSLAPAKAPLATCLLAAAAKCHVPRASPAGEREKEAGRALLQLRSGWKIGPLFPGTSPFGTSPHFCSALVEPLYSECSPGQRRSTSEEPQTFSWAREDLGPNPLKTLIIHPVGELQPLARPGERLSGLRIKGRAGWEARDRSPPAPRKRVLQPSKVPRAQQLLPAEHSALIRSASEEIHIFQGKKIVGKLPSSAVRALSFTSLPLKHTVVQRSHLQHPGKAQGWKPIRFS